MEAQDLQAIGDNCPCVLEQVGYRIKFPIVYLTAKTTLKFLLLYKALVVGLLFAAFIFYRIRNAKERKRQQPG